MICLYWYIYIHVCPLFYLHYLCISPLVLFIRLSYNLPVYFSLLCNCSVFSVVSVKNGNYKKKRVTRKVPTSRPATAHSSGAHVSANDFCGILVALSLVFCVIFCRLLLVLLSFYYDICIVSPSSIYSFWSLIIGHWKIKLDFLICLWNMFYCSNTSNEMGYKLIIRAIFKINNSTLNTNLPIINIV